MWAEHLPAHPAALVDGHPISFAELDRQCEADLADLRNYYQRTELGSKTHELELEKLNVLIDRELIIQAFYNEGGKIPHCDIDARVNSIVKAEFGGDRNQFDQVLQERGVSLATYRREIADNMINNYMQSKYVTDKILKSITDESTRSAQAQLIQTACFESLRKNAEIKIYLP